MDWAGVWGNYLDTQTDETGVGFNKKSWGNLFNPGGAQGKYLESNATAFNTSYGDMLASVPADQRRSVFENTMDDMAGRIGLGVTGDDLAGKFLGDEDAENKKQGLFDMVTENIVDIGDGIGVNVVPGFGGDYLGGDSDSDPGMQDFTSGEGWE